jgi:hypothetical protein
VCSARSFFAEKALRKRSPLHRTTSAEKAEGSYFADGNRQLDGSHASVSARRSDARNFGGLWLTFHEQS